MKGINTFTLKLIAICAMLIDHIGAVLLPQYGILRVIGRIAFPIFAYTLVEGFLHTHDVKKYLIRLGIAAAISEVPFDLAIYGRPIVLGHQNVFFTLFLGILMLYVLLKVQTTWKEFLCLIAFFLISEFLRTDYNSMGLFMIYWFYQYRESKAIRNLGVAAINVFLMGGLQAYATFALIPIALHSGEQGPKCKAFFYGFYPLHLLALYFIHIFI